MSIQAGYGSKNTTHLLSSHIGQPEGSSKQTDKTRDSLQESSSSWKFGRTNAAFKITSCALLVLGLYITYRISSNLYQDHSRVIDSCKRTHGIAINQCVSLSRFCYNREAIDPKILNNYKKALHWDQQKIHGTQESLPESLDTIRLPISHDILTSIACENFQKQSQDYFDSLRPEEQPSHEGYNTSAYVLKRGWRPTIGDMGLISHCMKNLKDHCPEKPTSMLTWIFGMAGF